MFPWGDGHCQQRTSTWETSSVWAFLVCSGCCNNVPQPNGVTNRNILSQSSGSWKYEVKVWSGAVASAGRGRICCRPSPRLWGFAAIHLRCSSAPAVALQPHCLRLHTVCSLCLYPFFSFYKDTKSY